MLFLENGEGSKTLWFVLVTSVQCFDGHTIKINDFTLLDKESHNLSQKTVKAMYTFIRDGIIDDDEFILTLDELIDYCKDQDPITSDCPKQIIPFKVWC